MSSLPTELRNLLERTVINAREEAEKAARAALVRLAVQQREPYTTQTGEERGLRNRLRAEARRLGETTESQIRDKAEPFAPLVAEVAYAQWHRMLFARFLAENGLLMHPEGVAVTLEECAELAQDEGEPDAWMLAARYAARMLPGIFRNEDPTVQVRFDAAGRLALERLLNDLPSAVFTADDSLGWVYQFWQTKRKKEVAESGAKIGGADLAPVTQLFTEHYMVQFLLHNSLGAWWAVRHPDSPLSHSVGEGAGVGVSHSVGEGVGGGGLSYLRLPTGSSDPNALHPTPDTRHPFSAWPERAADLRILDPCCGSGHFLVAAFALMRRFRMTEEGLSEAEAGDAVIRDNLFGLELDPRCTQIAVFNLALAAWKSGGYRDLPLPNIACAGLPVGDNAYEFTHLADGDGDMEATLRQLHRLFQQAPDLGSLIDPVRITKEEGIFAIEWDKVGPLLETALNAQRPAPNAQFDDPAAAIFGATAQGVARAADFLTRRYHLVITNVPYLARGKQGDTLKKHIETYHNDGKADLATAFIDRCLRFCTKGGSIAVVTPQNWTFLGSYKSLRERLLKDTKWNVVAKLGFAAFSDMYWWAFNTLLVVLTNAAPSNPHPQPLPHAVGEGSVEPPGQPYPSPLPHDVGEGRGEGEGGNRILPEASREMVRRARELRQTATTAEQLLWQLLRKEQLHGRQFRRQHPIGRFIADFFCDDARLIVEIDGAVHNEASQAERDREREAILRAHNLTVLRFTNEEVLHATEHVLQTLTEHVLTHTYKFAPSPPDPLSPALREKGGVQDYHSSPSQDHSSPLQQRREGISGVTYDSPLSHSVGEGVGGGGCFVGIDASAPRVPTEKAEILRRGPLHIVSQSAQLRNPDARIALEEADTGPLLEHYASGVVGVQTADYPMFGRCFWEIPAITSEWEFQQSTVEQTAEYAGREHIILWEKWNGELRRRHDAGLAYVRGRNAWGKPGVAVSSMNNLPVTLYTGELFDNNAAVIYPRDPSHLPAIWAFCSSPEFHAAVRRIDQALKVTNASLVKVPFDLERWQKVAAEQYPDGLPEPHSDDPTQWLFHGHPARAKSPLSHSVGEGPGVGVLQVAAARLLNYHWPQNEDDDLDRFADEDGIVCLPPVAGEPAAEQRLRELLAAAFNSPLPLDLGGRGGEEGPGKGWTHAVEERLLADAGFGGQGLGVWLRDGFFAQHCRLFHNRPFLWQIWDGRKDGFSAIVNYHGLDRQKLERLTYTYVQSWINAQRDADSRGVAGANARLVAAIALQEKLKAILEGEAAPDRKSGYDIYVRWKPLHKQPIGWEPDINDGVRLNIRPFVTAGILRAKFSINWNKDRGTNPDGSERLNDLHLTRAEKEAARNHEGEA